MKEKICFIICATNKIYLDECIYYIQNLNRPKNIEIEIVCIKDAKSMCAGYNQGMRRSDAKYKVYLHQDVFIQNPDFIEDVIRIFHKDATVGMIGMVGGIGMPQNAVTYLAWNVGCVDTKEPDVTYRMICSPEQEQDLVVDAIDGLIMVTQIDIPWREDLFDDFDFYDVSQSFEMRRAGYKIIVPYQKNPWVIHECNYAKLENYDKNRQVCIREYAEFLTEEDGFDFVYHKEWEELSDELADIVKGLIEKKEWDEIRELLAAYHNHEMKNSRLEMYTALFELANCDHRKGKRAAFFDGLDTVDEMAEKYLKTRFMLQRIECDKPVADYESFKDTICNGKISVDVLAYLILHFSLEKSKVLKEVRNWYSACGNWDAVREIEKIEDIVKKRGPIVVYSKRAAKEQAEKEKTGQTMLSICLICKNEEKNIEKCLNSFKNTGFEWIIVDTGSSDRTKQIVREYTQNVYDFDWHDDFAAAKNYAISKASNDMVMVIDSDEYLDQADICALEQIIRKNPDKVGRIKRRNIFHRDGQEQENREWINRIFSRKKFHYEGRIHEQVVAVDGNGNYETYEVPVTILHSGYDLSDEERKKKAKRNIDLLDLELQRLVLNYKDIIQDGKEQQDAINPQFCIKLLSAIMVKGEEAACIIQKDNKIPYVVYQLGKSYYMAGDYKNACTYFACGLYFDLNPKLEYVIDMVETYGYALLNSGQPERALFLQNVYDEFGNTADFKFLMGLIYMNNEMFDAAVEEFKKALKMPEGRARGVNSYLACYNIGVIYECLGQLSQARDFYQRCGNYIPAKKRLEVPDEHT